MASADVFLSSAEVSGDMHAGGLARALAASNPSLRLAGVGGQHLRDACVDVLHDTVSRARFGVTSFLRAAEVWGMLAKLRRHWEREGAPRLVVTCDSWTLNKHVLRLAGQFGCRRMYYVCPQVWASREGRVRQLAELTDAAACILPFEETFLRDRGVNATFVGHPLFDDLPSIDPRLSETPKIAINFGSRLNTVRNNLPDLVRVAERLRNPRPDFRFVTPTVAGTHELIRQAVPEWIETRRDDFDHAVAGSRLALTVSGTATLHTAAHAVPMIVVYRSSAFLWRTIGSRIVTTRTFALVNLLAQRQLGRDAHVVPEFVPWFGDADPVVREAERLLSAPEVAERQRQELEAVVEPLRQGGAAGRAATIATALLQN